MRHPSLMTREKAIKSKPATSGIKGKRNSEGAQPTFLASFCTMISLAADSTIATTAEPAIMYQPKYLIAPADWFV